MGNRVLKYIFSVLVALVLFATVLLWVLRAAGVESFQWFEYEYIAYVLCGGLGVASFLYMLLKRNRLFGWLAVIIFIPALVVAFVYGRIEIWIPFMILMIAGLILTFAIFGIKKWDVGDNQKAGYKTYAQRKAEEEAKEKKQQESLEKSRERAKQAAVSKAAAEAAAKAEQEFEQKHKK